MRGRIAITGHSFRMPGTTAETYWQDLLDGRDLVGTVDPQRWHLATFLHPRKDHPGTSYTFAAGSIGDVTTFDAAFFGISPREAALMDPQQRLLLEMSWEALENSGTPPSRLRGSRCGVFIGIASADYSFRMADDLAVADSTMATGNTASIAANRISYVFDLRGPSMAIDTACSSSLVALHQACRAIASGEVSQALAGGINLHLHPYGFIGFAKASMLSPRGRCQVFDEAADGYVRSEGGGLFFLKEYDQALADGDPILAVIAGSAVNTDGRKSGLTVPSAEVQAALLEEVYADAGIDPATIDYLEAHGTGTAVGDPIETLAIGKALGKRRPAGRPLPIGSVKSNLGHLETASGVAGLLKALHCLEHRVVPATIGVNRVNPRILANDWNIDLVTRNRSLPKTGKLTIGINSFGFGGSNAHFIIESPPRRRSRPQPAPVAAAMPPLLLSARSEEALKAAAGSLAAFLADQPSAAYYDVAHSAAFRRDWLEQRLIVEAPTLPEIRNALLDFAADRGGNAALNSGRVVVAARGPAFIYSGNGCQWSAMGRRLLTEEPLFRQAVHEVDALFRQHADFSLLAELAGENGDERYQRTEIAQPALFALQVGITRLLQRQGLTPMVVAGHSVGEVAAAWAAGALSLADAVKVIHQRSLLQGTTRGDGQMTAVALDMTAAASLLGELGLAAQLTIAGVNSVRGLTIAGAQSALTVLEEALSLRHVSWKRLDLDYAFHSPAMDRLEPGIREALAGIEPRASALPFCSTVSGSQLPGEELGAEYWWRNIREPVLFAKAVDSLLDQGITVFVEIGAHPILRTYLHDCLKTRSIDGQVIATGTRDDDGAQRIRSAAHAVAIAGAAVDWRAHFPRPGRFVRLPGYPWQRERHWHPVTSESLGLIHRQKIHPLLGYPLAQHELTWENQLDTQLNPVLADHVVGEATVLPGSAYVEMALTASLAWQPSAIVEIEDLEIRSPLLLADDRSAVVRLSIDPRDGSLTIRSREQMSPADWVVNASARVVREAQESLLREVLPDLPQRPPDFDADSHALLTRTVGIAYGPAFQCVEHGWVDGNSAFAALHVPPQVEAEVAYHHLHPALLDSTLQLMFQLLRQAIDTHEAIAFIPTRFGRVIFRSGTDTPCFARATLLRHSARSLQGEFALFCAAGRLIAIVKDARFRGVHLSRGSRDRLRFLALQAIPKPHPGQPAGPLALRFERVHSTLANVTQRAALKGTHRRYTEEVDPLLDSLCSRFTRRALQPIAGEDGTLSAAAILSCQAANPDAAPFFTDLIRLAGDDGSLTATGDGWTLVPDQREESTGEDIWNSLLADYPDYFQIIHSVGRIGLHLPALVAGSSSLSQICPQESSLATLLLQVVGGRGRMKLGQALGALVAEALAALPPGQRLGVVEISDGAPAFAMDICFALDFTRSDYGFASTSTTALEEARVRLGEFFPTIRTSLIDDPAGSEADLESPAGSCMMAIVMLDFATTEQALRALRHARRCLAAGASLLVLGQHPSRWIDFVFGARREGWSQSASGRWLSSQRPRSFWQQQLADLGCRCAAPCEFSPDTLSGPYLLLAEVDEPNPQPDVTVQGNVRSWILLADPVGYSARLADELAKKLQERKDLVIQANATDTEELAGLLQATTTSYGELDGLVMLTGLVPASPALSADEALDHQVERCALAARIMQACERSATRTTCWLITANAGAALLPAAAASASDASSPDPSDDAALCGFVRTMLNEAEPGSVRLIDLALPMPAQTAAGLLDREFEQPDGELEIILAAAGQRYVPRLRDEPRPDARTPRLLESPTVSLGFPFAGQLRNLRWETHPRVAPAPDEVEVEVLASGLNFRDVMYALGLLSDEAIENGFAGPTLGFEFAGVIARVGSNCTGFSPGDEVVGFAPSSFGNRVLTQSSAVAHFPPGLSAEAAATIPSTFFTVYYALHHLARLQAGERVLIHGAAGGVGIAAIQIARWLGAEIYATAGSDEKRDFLRLLGVVHIFDSRSLSFADQILEQSCGEGVDVVLNSLAGEAINRNFRVLRPFGRFLELGKRDFYENSRIGLRPFRNNVSYFGIDADQLMLLHPELTRRLFAELMELFSAGILHPLPYRNFEAEDVVEAFRYMQQARQIGKIVITYHHGIRRLQPPRPGARRRLQLAADASYLVTGGLSGFGLRAAEWLASKGARHLILISRGGPESASAREAIQRLEEQGVRVYAAACDVTSRDALMALLAATRDELPPLKGVLHAATVIDDALVRNLDETQIRRSLAAKVLGARHLHELTRPCALDLFVLFSSATAAFGNPGQAAYVAANTWLEALAAHRRAQGLCATAVGWGPIADCGFLVRNEKMREALENRLGGAALTSELALDVLEEMLLSDRSGLAALEFAWQVLSRVLPSAGSPKFGELASPCGGGGDDEQSQDIRRLLAELGDEELLVVIADMLRSEIGEILRIAPEKIDASRSLFDMGLDSLMGVELAVALDARFGIRLPVLALSQSPTINRLAERLLQQLRDTEEGARGEATTDGLLAQTAQIARQQGVAVSAEEIARFAADLDAAQQDDRRPTRDHHGA
ncbi:MAG: SDR family NAD(P)-dependent oxidoreductase [Accumulibacter sp.]|jgi:phthiocerol/phenolphthiocerol synthesis type-I polyketide synthase C|uniref:SDR family NAD(P)-dependent oxidoreductase n=1 Tax=Accumulibacter sp. TaxID=2053492 RepID=UPI002FC2DEA8